MIWNKFEYFLNAILYSLWLSEIRSDIFIEKGVNRMLSLISKYLFTTRYRQKLNEHQTQRKFDYRNFRYDREYGLNISSAKHWFGFFYSCYPMILSFIIFALITKYWGTLSYSLILFAIPIIIAYIPAYRAVFWKDRYICYFKLFEQEQIGWHKKWKMIKCLFIIGAVLSIIIGIAAMWIVLRYF